MIVKYGSATITGTRASNINVRIVVSRKTYLAPSVRFWRTETVFERPAVGDQHAAQRRPDDARDVEAGRVERERVHDVVFRHQVRHHGLAHGHVEGPGNAGQDREREEVPDLEPAGRDDEAHHERREEQESLRAEHQRLTVEPVRRDATEGRQEQ
jgi:hypothetical protein